ncbi:hypothetical protein CANINC_000797 [Pichia inconspicua]|uniref:Uncharacterized protein n=1 Tax=Pichia inconspicua TaxID=52247 RepID=A0A4T0X6K5_9ASCO|nr:hypothetical protein CANINC_000797 [[Candida] inconspicua]
MGKDVIREDKVKKYVHVVAENKLVATDFVSTNLPMAAMFLKNRMLAWASLFFAVQSYLNRPIIKRPGDESQSPSFRILFALIALVTSYLDLIFPAMSGPRIAEKIIESTN